MNPMTRVFNEWQIYDACKTMYKHKTTKSIKKLKQFGTRDNVFKFKMITIDNDVMFLVKNNINLFIIFLGSNDLEDWIDNFEAEHEIYKDISFHKGFLNSMLKFKDDIELFIRKNKKLGDIYYIGHSRGGALALVASIIMQLQLGESILGNVYTTTYGQPRIGNETIGNTLIKNSIDYLRVFFSADIVCDVPPISMDYQHPYNNIIFQLPSKLWHRLHFMFRKVHTSYGTVINNFIYHRLNKLGNRYV